MNADDDEERIEGVDENVQNPESDVKTFEISVLKRLIEPVFDKATKNDGRKDFTVHDWSDIFQAAQAEVEQGGIKISTLGSRLNLNPKRKDAVFFLGRGKCIFPGCPTHYTFLKKDDFRTQQLDEKVSRIKFVSKRTNKHVHRTRQKPAQKRGEDRQDMAKEVKITCSETFS